MLILCSRDIYLHVKMAETVYAAVESSAKWTFFPSLKPSKCLCVLLRNNCCYSLCVWLWARVWAFDWYQLANVWWSGAMRMLHASEHLSYQVFLSSSNFSPACPFISKHTAIHFFFFPFKVSAWVLLKALLSAVERGIKLVENEGCMWTVRHVFCWIERRKVRPTERSHG